ncbi:hypothetical protein [Chryseobacterium sp. Leaf394]|uniref:hypothetical protein n=1 Tax=Chryseobacterium sp. Leaf394 TaxID=1736361 RepID=UPI0006F4437B|nr:hypothetical protein [Chryseobacterium sp. Leaf394]KQS89937.1 hypothetical protein ASG21_13250 [Chryseobacterium sp. Leaf394]
MTVNLTPKPINFKLGDYLNKGFELLKNNFGNIFTAFLCCFVMAIIPFCGMLGAGNFYLYLRKINKGQQASAGEIFNFDRFMPYFMLQLIIIGGIIAMYVPVFLLGLLAGVMNGGEPSAWFSIVMIPYMIAIYVAIFYFVLKGFYIPALIAFKNITEIKTAWNISKVMTKNNLLNIFLFSIVVSLLAQVGIIACVIGVFVTAPFAYTANYFAYEDAIQQIEVDEISEIGIQEKF